MKLQTPKIIVNDNYGKDIIYNEPSKKIVTDYTQWTYDIAPIIPTAKSAWDYQANQIKQLEQAIKNAALVIQAKNKVLSELKEMYEQLVKDNYEMEMKNHEQ
jgi:hypothetical protein